MKSKMYVFLIRAFLIIICVFTTQSCSLQKINKIRGIVNLESKAMSLIENKSNKNDVEKLLGKAPVIEFYDPNLWSYFETQETASFFGQKTNIVNNILILKFDEKNILQKKLLLIKDQMQQIEFENTKTISKGVDESLLKSLLSSARKRIENLSKK